MTHFSVLIITDKNPTMNEIDSIMGPYHEFESTGIDNEYIQEVDITDAARKTFEDAKSVKYLDPFGNMYDPYQDRFYRYPTPEEEPLIGGGFGCGNGLCWDSKNWGDGRGYRTKIHFLPDGWAETIVKTKDIKTFGEWAVDYFGLPIIINKDVSRPCIANSKKYGWIEIEECGGVKAIIQRTNPNAKWDWWDIGGRYANWLTLMPGIQPCPGIRKNDVDLESMRAKTKIEAGERWDKVRTAIGDMSDFVPWPNMINIHDGNIPIAREAYFSQRAIKILEEQKGSIPWGFGDKLEDFMVDKNTYVDNEVMCSTVSFAYIKDGQWFERGEIGWFATISNPDDEWDRTFNDMLYTLSGDTWLTVVDCHI